MKKILITLFLLLISIINIVPINNITYSSYNNNYVNPVTSKIPYKNKLDIFLKTYKGLLTQQNYLKLFDSIDKKLKVLSRKYKNNNDIVLMIGYLKNQLKIINDEFSNSSNNGYRKIRISKNGKTLDVFVDKPNFKEVDVLLVFHGTVKEDSIILLAAETMLKSIKKIINKKDLMIISVAYPQEGLLIGDNIEEAKAAFLWTKYNAEKELGVKINKIFLMGHSQGGYIVSRLNTLYKNDGVIANGPGPIDLSERCKEDERVVDQAGKSKACYLLKKEYGSVFKNPEAYKSRSLINFSSGYKGDILFIQGMEDKEIQIRLWDVLKDKVKECKDCSKYTFLEIEGHGHDAVFENQKAIDSVNEFIGN